MNKPPYTDADKEPWHRQFWPWFLILLPGSVVIASLITLYIAATGADDLVADEYYKDGLAINRRLGELERAAELELAAELVFEDVSVQVALEAPGDPRMLQLDISHPLEADRDFSVRLSRIATGYYAGRLQNAVAPRWHWSLEPVEPGDWRLDGVVDDADMADERDR